MGRGQRPLRASHRHLPPPLPLPAASLHWVRGWAAQPDQAGQAAEPDLLLVERLSPRLYKFQRGEVVLLRWVCGPRRFRAGALRVCSGQGTPLTLDCSYPICTLPV